MPELGNGWTKTCRINQDSKRRLTIYRSPQGGIFRSMKCVSAHLSAIAILLGVMCYASAESHGVQTVPSGCDTGKQLPMQNPSRHSLRLQLSLQMG